MSKTLKIQSPAKKPKHLYSTHPWKCHHSQDHTDIVAYVEASGHWEVVCIARDTSGASAESMATYISGLINDQQKNQTILNAAIDALELCLNEANLTFTSEQAVDSVLLRIKQRTL